PAVRLASIAGLALLVGGLAANLGVRGALAATLAVLGGFLLVGLAVFDRFGLELALANPLAAGALTYTGATAYRVAVERRQARALQAALASVIPPAVAREIARDPDRVRLGGERRTISVLFTDLKGFTTFSETVDPQVLARIMTEYLEAMTA